MDVGIWMSLSLWTFFLVVTGISFSSLDDSGAGQSVSVCNSEADDSAGENIMKKATSLQDITQEVSWESQNAFLGELFSIFIRHFFYVQ